jgi:hypothetical protein
MNNKRKMKKKKKKEKQSPICIPDPSILTSSSMGYFLTIAYSSLYSPNVDCGVG